VSRNSENAYFNHGLLVLLPHPVHTTNRARSVNGKLFDADVDARTGGPGGE
jgi:hypothetical protein